MNGIHLRREKSKSRRKRFKEVATTIILFSSKKEERERRSARRGGGSPSNSIRVASNSEEIKGLKSGGTKNPPQIGGAQIGLSIARKT